MATEALQRQIQGKWQNAFARLNRDQQGITGLLGFSEVRSETVAGTSELTNGSRHGHLPPTFSILATSMTPRQTRIGVCLLPSPARVLLSRGILRHDASEERS